MAGQSSCHLFSKLIFLRHLALEIRSDGAFRHDWISLSNDGALKLVVSGPPCQLDILTGCLPYPFSFPANVNIIPSPCYQHLIIPLFQHCPVDPS
eukprot:scaffold11575_cov66-Attheya_sp.AAC.2